MRTPSSLIFLAFASPNVLALRAPLPAIAARPNGGAVRCVATAIEARSGCAAVVLGGGRQPSRARPLRMQEAPFWQNVERFARFAISSVLGLILTLLSPFQLFARSPALAAVGRPSRRERPHHTLTRRGV